MDNCCKTVYSRRLSHYRALNNRSVTEQRIDNVQHYCKHYIKRLMSFLLCVSTKIEKEKREHAKQHGMIRTEITGAEIAEEMEKERRLFQLQMCEVNNEMCP